jgi:putative transcriptional regulator
VTNQHIEVKQLREWLRNIRQCQNKTQEQVAAQASISRTYYARIESNVRGQKLPVPTAQRIASVLNFDWRLFYEDSKKVINIQQLKIGGGKNE